MRVGGSYANKLNDIKKLKKQILKDLSPIADSFDTIVATGTSGMMIAPIIAMLMDKNIVAVRKPNDNAHSSSLMQGEFGKRWIFLDDFIATGSTFRRVLETVNNEIGPYNSTFVGAYLYELYSGDRYIDADKLGVYSPRPTNDDSGFTLVADDFQADEDYDRATYYDEF